MVCFALPYPWSRFASIGYLFLALVLISGLQRDVTHGPGKAGIHWLFSLLGLSALAFWFLWLLTPVQNHTTGIPVILLWSTFSTWSAVRLIRMLSSEREINTSVLMGALSGYLMLGFSAGLLLCGLETLSPDSFSGIELNVDPANQATTVWGLNFAQLNYFAFVSLTTMGYGDVVPVTSFAQMLCVVIGITGTFYIATVMGILISRLTVQESSR